jgi:hypothetical protein
MLGGPPLTRALARRPSAAVSDSDEEATGYGDRAFDDGSTRGCRGIRTETTAAMTADNAPPITTR